ncbi:MAG: phosphoribosylanthranilate isomerase [Calditrichaeota bacterium]|nr:MAG: phosphoribosylanthranilate isomerase [Calditrichota bacterium]
MPTRIKICGITRLSDALHCASLGVEMLGFNFYPESPRYIEPARARAIIHRLPPSVLPVGLLVRPSRREVEHLIETTGVRMVQLYFPQADVRLAELPVPAILAHPLNPETRQLPDWATARYLLLDAVRPGLLGGTGRTLDWRAIPPELPRNRLMLAGGLTPENVTDAITMVRPAAVDVASGVETAPGQKDPARVSAFVQAVRLADGQRAETRSGKVVEDGT